MSNPVAVAVARIRDNANTLHISSTLSGRIVTSPRIHPNTLRKLFSASLLRRKDGQYSWYRLREDGERPGPVPAR